jgi:hypothetical protein
LILMYSMDDFGWSGRELKCRMWCNRLVFVLWAVENLDGEMSRPGHYPCNQLITDPNHCFPTTTTDLDTSNGWFWMVWKGIQVQDGMQ